MLMNNDDTSALLHELKSVKMLLVLQLLATGLKQRQIAMMLGISEATMSRMIPKGLVVGRTLPVAPYER